MKPNYLDYLRAQRERVRAGQLPEKMCSYARSRQEGILSELAALAGVENTTDICIPASERIEMLVMHLREDRSQEWRALVSEFWSLENSLN